jgi:hypothetical protein
MAMIFSREIDIDALPDTGMGPASFILHAGTAGADVLIALCGPAGKSFKIHMPTGQLVSLLALSHDGTTVALWIRQPDQRDGYVIRLDLMTAAQEIFEGYRSGTIAAFIPGGKSLAIVHGDGSQRAVLTLVDGNGVEVRHDLAGDINPAQNTLSWSPDGRLLVLDCFSSDGCAAVALIDPITMVADEIGEEMELFATSNGVWIDSSRILVADEEPEIDSSGLQVLDVRTKELARLDAHFQHERLPRAVVGDFLFYTSDGNVGVKSIWRSRLDGGDATKIAVLSSELPLRRLEIAPHLVASSASHSM